MTAVWLAAMALAAYRLALLVSSDVVTIGLRHWIAQRFPARRVGPFDKPRAIVRAVHCGRCMGVWTGALVAVGGNLAGVVPSWRQAALVWWALAGATALLVRVEP